MAKKTSSMASENDSVTFTVLPLYFVHVTTNSIHSSDPLDAISSRWNLRGTTYPYIHSRQSDRVARVDMEMDCSAVVPWVVVATWSAARHASKVDLQRSALANTSEFFTSASAPMPTASESGRSITPGPRTTSNQSPNSTPKNEIHTKSNVKSIKKKETL